MKFLLWGDIHSEFEEFPLPEVRPEGLDCILCPGDIWTKGRAVKKLERIAQWAACPVIATPGNHDYYGDSIWKSDERMMRQASESQFDIRILNPGVTEVAGTRIVAATLWTDYRMRQRDGDNAIIRNACESIMNDHKRIRWGYGSFRPVKADDLAGLHLKHKNFISQTLSAPHDGPSLVMTHHAPSEQSVKFRQVTEHVDHAYASNLETFILDHTPDMWIHAHTHNREDYEIGSCRVISNSKGYPDQETGFDPLQVFEIPSRLAPSGICEGPS
ncbi:metallophosphoesterase [Pseudosulfitobacter pseudonitzschiae]|uniref:metallophosphoesterase n=1 Tax=Pseudosulfitobacter pseudonitzschiae TaxID=1402135 RepID=UPI003B75E2F1